MIAKHLAILFVLFSAFGVLLGQTFSATYCAMIYQPYCPSGCNFYDLDYVSCSSTCGELSINAPVSATFPSETCFTANLDNNPYSVRCRVDPSTNMLCLQSDESTNCYRPRQLISFNFYTYANSASAQPYFVIMGYGPCNNQSLETELERASFSPLCDNAELNQDVDGDQESITLGLVSCSSGSCSEDILATYTIDRGTTLKIKIVNDYAFGVRFTGNQVCFSWQRKTVRYYLDFSPDYDNMCMMQCVSVKDLGSFFAEYSLSRYYDGTSSSNGYAFVTDASPSLASSAAIVMQANALFAMIAVCLAHY
jgi:hypothetical protein